jgi:hypothetical protein
VKKKVIWRPMQGWHPATRRAATKLLGIRLSRDLDVAIKQLRDSSYEQMKKTLASEKVIRAGLEKLLASDPRNRRNGRRRKARAR